MISWPDDRIFGPLMGVGRWGWRPAALVGVVVVGLLLGSTPASAAVSADGDLSRHARNDSGTSALPVDNKAEALVGGTVTFADGSAVMGLVVDFFVANPDGSRSTWLGDVETDESGVFSRLTTAGCYVLTYIAPPGEFFVGGGSYFQTGVCIQSGEKVTDLDAQLESSPKGKALLGGTVRFADGSAVVGLVADFFEAMADGSRGTWLGDETSDNDGFFHRGVEPGCYILVLIAPMGTEFSDGGRFHEVPVCVAAGETRTIDARLMIGEDRCVVQGQVVATAVSGAECRALIALFTNTGGPNWIDATGWDTPTDPCSWVGVACEDLELRGLDLSANDLSGPIPAEVRLLRNLRTLDLSENFLTGDIPPEMGLLSNLEILDLGSDTPGRNRLTGPIPPELGDLGELRVLNLKLNRLSGRIPDELGRLTNLKRLDLSLQALFRQIGLNGPIPKGLGQLTNLTSLDLSGNNLDFEIPPELGDLTSLVSLDLGGNLLITIPPELGNLANLEVLILFDNRLTGGLPPELGRLTKLRVLTLNSGGQDGNRLTGPIPPELGGLLNLEVFRARNNGLSGPIPPELGRLSRLRELAIESNRLTGPLPEELGRLTALERLDLRSNMLTVDITGAMTGLRAADRLTVLGLSDGEFGSSSGNNCLVVTDSALAAWLTGLDPNWDECD